MMVFLYLLQMMKLKFFIILLSCSIFCFGQKQSKNNNYDINYKDVIEIKNLIFFKADTTLVTGKVIRYNKKNEAKKYILVSKGKLDNYGWIHINDGFTKPKESNLGELIKGSAKVMRFTENVTTGNGLNIPNPEGDTDYDLKEFLKDQNDYTNKAYNEMSERNDISHDLELNNSSGNRKDGAWELYYPNKSLESRGNYNDNKREGIWEEYYENGQLKSKSYYVQGKKENLFELYHTNGNLKGKLYYKNGKEDGNFEMYHRNGILSMAGKFKEGKQIGVWKYYNKKGELIYTDSFEN